LFAVFTHHQPGTDDDGVRVFFGEFDSSSAIRGSSVLKRFKTVQNGFPFPLIPAA
jgi:hypothetical protein